MRVVVYIISENCHHHTARCLTIMGSKHTLMTAWATVMFKGRQVSYVCVCCMYVHVCIYVSVCVCVCICICILLFSSQTYTHTYKHIHARTYIHKHTHLHIHIDMTCRWSRTLKCWGPFLFLLTFILLWVYVF